MNADRVRQNVGEKKSGRTRTKSATTYQRGAVIICTYISQLIGRHCHPHYNRNKPTTFGFSLLLEVNVYIGKKNWFHYLKMDNYKFCK